MIIPMARYVLTFTYTDPDARAAARPQHLDYLRGLHEEGKVVMAGPWGDGSGALVVFDVADEAEAQAIVDADPYTAAGVVGSPQLREWNVVIPVP